METRLIHTRHPLLIDSRTNTVAEYIPGESLYAFLARNVERFGEEQIVVSVNGDVIDCAEWHNVTLKHKAQVEVRNVVKRTALYIVAMVVLAYFTMGASLGVASAGAAGATSFTAFGMTFGSAMAANMAIAGVQVAGALLINKVLGPKVPSLSNESPDPVFQISSSRNAIREYQPPGLLFGTVKIAPDLISRPYTFYRGNDQFVSMILTPGFNVASIEPLYNGETLLSQYDGVRIWHSNYSGMPDQKIPHLTNVDQVAGGTLDPGVWVVRTTSPNTLSISMDIEYVLFDKTSKGKDKSNNETLVAEYRVAGSNGAWQNLWTRSVSNFKTDTIRMNVTVRVQEGQYETRLRRLGNAIEFANGVAQFRYVSLSSIQPDNATYQGFPRTAVEIMATGQLNGVPDTLRCIAHSKPIEVWNGTAWVLEETSNPGAHALRYIRGIYDEEGELVAGLGWSDDRINIESWKSFMLHCRDNNFTYDHWITDPRNHWDVLKPIMLAGMGKVAWPDGRIAAVWAAEGQASQGAVNMATIKRGSFQVDYTLSRSADGIEFTYYDKNDWTSKILRVKAPGVTTMLNPARLSGEGIVDEAHAAMIARYHLAQSIYQYKDIVYATDIEAMTYRTMDMLDLQHDMTQWGYGGNVMAASRIGDVVTIQLDEPVPMPDVGDAYLGLRIPGERVCRVFKVLPFVGESDTLTLEGVWPADAALPGDHPGNPAHDTIWMYDFSASPGARVRVVGMELDYDLKGGKVAVVQEGDEFWNYVHTGEYIPPESDSLLNNSPIASNLRISEVLVVQGDTVFTELQAIFDIDGYAVESVVLMAGSDQIFQQVARTTTRSAQWRIPGPGTYTIAVRPMGDHGKIGRPATTIYTTIGADAPPILYDYFTVLDLDGGIRRYEFGFNPGSNRSPDMAGAEIRFIAGTETAPDWETMEPLGAGDGFFTAPFEAATPVAGTYTFALRTRNTSGDLSTDMRVVNITLRSNVGEVIGGIEESLDEITQRQIGEQMRLDQEIADRLAADLATAAAAAADATTKANAALSSAMAAVAALEAQLADVMGAPEWDPIVTYPADSLSKYDGALYRALVETTGDQPDISPAAWEKVGDYASLGEAVAAAVAMATQNASDIEAEVARINALYARMPTGSGTLATEALVASEASALATQISAQATRVDGLVARMPAAAGVLATEASVNSVASASVTRDDALSTRIDTVTTTANGAQSTAGQALTAANNAATVASQAQTTANGASTTATNALSVANGAASAVTTVSNNQMGGGNILRNSEFAGLGGWTVFYDDTAGALTVQPHNGVLPGDSNRYIPQNATALMFRATSTLPTGWVKEMVSDYMPVKDAARIIASVWVNCFRCNARMKLYRYNAAGQYIGEQEVVTGPTSQNAATFDNLPRLVIGHDNTATHSVRISLIVQGIGQANTYAWFILPMVEKAPAGKTGPSPWSPGAAGLASATLELKVAQDAQITMVTDVNGHVSGTVSKNDGVRSSFSILASVFRVISTVTGMGMEWQDGYLRIWRGSGQLLLGHNFGTGNLLLWAGPNVGAANCTKANAMFWLDTAGTGYFAGQVLQGVLRAFNSTTAVNYAGEVSTGTLDTKGTQVALRGGLDYQANQVHHGPNAVITLNNGVTGATVYVERRYRNAADTAWEGWVVLSERRFSGSEDVFNEPGAAAYITWTISGTIQISDVASTRKREYRTRIASMTLRPHSVTNPGPTPAMTHSQYQFIESME